MAIRVDATVFAEEVANGLANQYVMVSAPSDESFLADALRRAAHRFLRVGEDGVETEHSNGEASRPQERFSPNWVSDVHPGSSGPWIYVDCKGSIPVAMRDRLVTILIEELEAAEIRDARVFTPDAAEMSGGPLAHLALVPGCTLLALFPPPPPLPSTSVPQVADRPQLPEHWIDVAADWLTRTSVTGSAAMASFGPSGISAYMPIDEALDRLRAEGRGLLVVGDLSNTFRGVHAHYGAIGRQPRLILALGGPSSTDDALLLEADVMKAMARGLAAELAYGFVSFDPNFKRLAYPDAPPEWTAAGGECPVVNPWMELLLDEVALDAFHYQILGPRHIQRLGGPPRGAVPLDKDRVEVAVGSASEWLLTGETDRRSTEEAPTAADHRQNPSVQAQARRLLAKVLLRSGEAMPLIQERRRGGPPS